MTTVLDPPATAGLSAVRAAVGAAAAAELWQLTDTRELARSRGATSMTGWLRGSHLLGPGEARAADEMRPRAARALPRDRGSVGRRQPAPGPGRSHPGLPDGEHTLLGLAGSYDPIGLGQLGRRLEEVLDPEGVQERDEAKIRDHEKKAFDKREFTLSPDPYGSAGTIRGRYDTEGGAIVNAVLDALSGPLPAGPDREKDPRSPAQRRYDAVIEGLRRLLGHPPTGSGDGGKAQIRVTIPLNTLTDKVGAGKLDSGAEISPTLARKLACDAALIPVILDGAGQPLDLGLGTPPPEGDSERASQRGTSEERSERGAEHETAPAPPAPPWRSGDGGCTWPGCPRPIQWCDSHHLIPWHAGGRTDQVNGGLLCGAHHFEIEKGDWEAVHHRGRIWLRPRPVSTPPEDQGSTPNTDPSHPRTTGHPTPPPDPRRRTRCVARPPLPATPRHADGFQCCAADEGSLIALSWLGHVREPVS